MGLVLGTSQLINTTDIDSNLVQILTHLDDYGDGPADEAPDLVLFPECALTGFSANITQHTPEILLDMLAPVLHWASAHRCFVVVPSAWIESGRIYNAGWIISPDGMCEPFYKQGLTESEQRFFSCPPNVGARTIRIHDQVLGLVICREIEDAPATYLTEPSYDAILWPGYYGWGDTQLWASDESPSAVARIKSAQTWSTVLVQSNWAVNGQQDTRSTGPTGMSVIAQGDILLEHGPHWQSSRGIIRLQQHATPDIKWYMV